jgi:hypothetical protein
MKYLINPQVENHLRTNVVPNALQGNPESLKQFDGFMNKFINGSLNKVEQTLVQAYSKTSDFTNLLSEPVQQLEEYFDVGYAPLFVDAMPFDLGNGKTFSKFSIPTGEHTLLFKKVPEGGEVEVQSVKGQSVDVKYEKIMLNIGITDELIKFPDRWDIMRWELLNVRHAHYQFLADMYYKLINMAAQAEVSASQFTAYDTVGSSTLEKDINTINKSVLDLATKLQNKPYGNVASMPLYLLCHISLRARILSAIRYTFTGIAGQSPNMVNTPVIPVFSFNANLTTNNSYARLVLPGRTIQKSVLAELEREQDRNITNKTAISSYTTWMGAGIGDSKQIQEVRFA